MAAPKGNKFAGSRKGIPNKLTKTVKETVLAVFNDMQSDPKANLLTWGKANPKDFYLIAAKLIPTEITGKNGDALVQATVINVLDSNEAAKLKEIEKRLDERK